MCCSVDLSKAFDTVDHAILLIKLSSIGLSSNTCSWFHDYLRDRTQAVMMDGVKSGFLEVHKCVPQGSILGLVLTTIYIKHHWSICKQWLTTSICG